MTAPARRPGRPDGPERTDRFVLRLTPDELEQWRALAARYECTLADLVRDAVRYYSDRDEEDELADLGRTVLRVAREHMASRPGRSARRRP